MLIFITISFQTLLFGSLAATWPPPPPRKTKIAKRALAPRVRDLLEFLGKNAFLETAIQMNAFNVLIGVLGFIAFFNLSLGPVMWVMLSEMYPNKIRGLAIGTIGLVNSFTAWLVTQIFPWELSNLGGSTTFLVFGLITLGGFFILLKLLPETKGKSLEQLESELIKN